MIDPYYEDIYIFLLILFPFALMGLFILFAMFIEFLEDILSSISKKDKK